MWDFLQKKLDSFIDNFPGTSKFNVSVDNEVRDSILQINDKISNVSETGLFYENGENLDGTEVVIDTTRPSILENLEVQSSHFDGEDSLRLRVVLYGKDGEPQHTNEWVPRPLGESRMHFLTANRLKLFTIDGKTTWFEVIANGEEVQSGVSADIIRLRDNAKIVAPYGMKIEVESVQTVPKWGVFGSVKYYDVEDVT